MMVPKRKKYCCKTTRQDKSWRLLPNLVKDMEINASDQAVCSDITYIYTEEGFLFLSLMMDMFRWATSSAGRPATAEGRGPWPRWRWRAVR